MMETIAALNKEKDELLHLSMERAKLIQVLYLSHFVRTEQQLHCHVK